MLNLNFLNWLFKLGNQYITEFIYFLFKDYLKYNLIEKTNRSITISGLKAHIISVLGY
jgi:hypothetical protein